MQPSDKRLRAAKGSDVEELAGWHLLTSVRGLGPRAAAAIHTAGIRPMELVSSPDRYPLRGKRAQAVVEALRTLNGCRPSIRVQLRGGAGSTS